MLAFTYKNDGASTYYTYTRLAISTKILEKEYYYFTKNKFRRRNVTSEKREEAQCKTGHFLVFDEIKFCERLHSSTTRIYNYIVCWLCRCFPYSFKKAHKLYQL